MEEWSDPYAAAELGDARTAMVFLAGRFSTLPKTNMDTQNVGQFLVSMLDFWDVFFVCHFDVLAFRKGTFDFEWEFIYPNGGYLQIIQIDTPSNIG